MSEAPAVNSTSLADAVEKVVEWLADRHRKGWLAFFQRLRNEVLSTTEIKKLCQLDIYRLERVKGLLCSYEVSGQTIAAQQGRGEISDDFLWKSLGLPHS